ncbi:hypothetical protein Tco_1409348 [Tanacetum coccineum]
MITYIICQRTTKYDKIQENDLWLLSMFGAKHQNGYANVAWVIAKWMKKKGAGTQKESQICCGQFISKLARKSRVLTDEVLRSLSAPTYCKDLDTTTLRDLIDSEDMLIPEDPQPGVPRVGIPRPSRASMQDLYDRMGRMEIRQEAIERMEYRQSYHWDIYAGVFEHMAGVYNIPMQGAYNPPSYAQPYIPADQLVRTNKYQHIGRCNNYAVLTNVPCLKECKIVLKLLVDHALSDTLTATVDILAVYLQKFWKTIKQVLNENNTIRFKLNNQEITYTVDMFRATLQLPVGTLDNPFIEPADLDFIQPFLKINGYQGIVDKVSAFFTKNLAQPWQTMFKVFNRCPTSRTLGHDQTKINILQIFHDKKDVIQYPRFTKLIIVDFMQKFDTIPKRLEEDYPSIKDDISLVSVYTTGNVTVRGMMIPVELLNDDIRETQEYKDYAKEFVRKRKRKEVVEESSTPRKSLKVTIKQKKPSSTSIPPPSDNRERDEIHEATQLSIIMHKTALTAEVQENVAKVQEKSLEEDIEKMVDGEDEESYTSAFVDSVFQDDDETNTRIEPRSHKENPKVVDDDVNNNVDKEKKDDDDENDDNDDHDDHALVRNKVSGSLETRNEKMHTPIPPPPRSPRTNLSSYKTISEELTNSAIHKNVDNVLHDIILKIASNATNNIIEDNIPRVIVDVVMREKDTFQDIEIVVDEVEVILEDGTPKLIEEFQNFDKRVLTIFDYKRMEATLRDIMSNQFKDAKEYAYYLEQKKNYMENQIVLESRHKDISRLRSCALVFYGPQRNPNEPLRYLYNKDLFFLKHGNSEVRKKVRNNSKEYFSDHMIVEVVRVTIDQPYGLDFMKQIIMMRENDKPDSFSEANFKYMKKNDIEDLYYLCLNKKVNYRDNKLKNSLMKFIKSYVIWERVHDFQLGIKSYQININLTAFLGIEARDPYSIMDKPTIGLIYLNNKNEKRVMYLIDISKFCDATLERVLNEVKLRIFETEFLNKAPLMVELDLNIMKAYVRKITKRLHHREQMRRWDSFVNERPILPTMRRQ